jgi:hypothetical protein
MPTILGYQPSDVDAGSSPKYYGFICDSGAWYIMRTTDGGNTIRYYAGYSGYVEAWDAKAASDFDYWPNRYDPQPEAVYDGGDAAASGPFILDGGDAAASGSFIVDGGGA